MQSFLNYAIFFILSAFGLSAYFLNPYRSGSLLLGLLLQAFAIVVLFLTTVSQEHALKRHTNMAHDTAQTNRSWLIGSISVVCVCGALLILGVPYKFLRFLLFLFFWAGAIGAGQYLCYFVWRRNNEELAEQLVKEDEQKRVQALAAQEQAKAASERMRQAEQAREYELEDKRMIEAARQKTQHGIIPLPHEIPTSLPFSTVRQRVEDLPDMMLAMRLMAGDESALSEALTHPTRNALAAIEEIIARNSSCNAAVFYRNGGLLVATQSSIEETQNRLMFLAKSHQLYVNPAWSQYLISQLGKELATNMLMKINQSCEREDVFAYQLLGVEMQLAAKLGI